LLQALRVIGVFLEAESDGKERTLYLSLAYFKGDQQDVTEKEVLNAIADLREAITQGDLPEDFTADPDSN
jgi:hypothetical protein